MCIRDRVNTTASLSLLAENDHNTNGLLAREVIEKSADLVATHIAGIAEYKQSDTVFVLEGSLFWKGYHYKERVEEVVRKLTRYSVAVSYTHLTLPTIYSV